MSNIHQCKLFNKIVLKYLVFNEFLSDNSNLYRYVIPVCFGFIVVMLILLLIIVKEIKEKKLIN